MQLLRGSTRHDAVAAEGNTTFLIFLFLLCVRRRTRRYTEEDLHEVGEQAFEKGETASRILGFSLVGFIVPRRFLSTRESRYSRHRLN